MVNNILSIFKAFPLLVAIPTIVMCVFFFMPKHRVLVLIGLVLMIYLPVLFAPKLVQYCAGECAVPIDLLLVFLQVLIGFFTGLAYLLMSVFGEVE